MPESLKWIEPIYPELGICRLRVTQDSAWSYGWNITGWASQLRPICRREDGETIDCIPVEQIEVRDV